MSTKTPTVPTNCSERSCRKVFLRLVVYKCIMEIISGGFMEGEVEGRGGVWVGGRSITVTTKEGSLVYGRSTDKLPDRPKFLFFWYLPSRWEGRTTRGPESPPSPSFGTLVDLARNLPRVPVPTRSFPMRVTSDLIRPPRSPRDDKHSSPRRTALKAPNFISSVWFSPTEEVPRPNSTK